MCTCVEGIGIVGVYMCGVLLRTLQLVNCIGIVGVYMC